MLGLGRRTLIAVACGLVALGCAGGAVALGSSHDVHGTGITVPDLTGGWRNVNDPSTIPAWQLTASNMRQTLDASWRGNAASGHPDLRGSFHATLNLDTNLYEGRYQVTENAPPQQGHVTVKVDSANQIEITLTHDAGGQEKYTFKRVSGGGAPPAAVNVARAPAAFGTTVSEGAPMPGDVGAGPSPPLGNATSADASVSGVSQNDLVFYALVIQATRQYCYLEAVRTLATLAKDPTTQFTADANADSVHNELLNVGFDLGLRVVSCMSDAAAIQAAIDQLAASAGVHAAGCGVTPLITTVGSASGTPDIKKIQVGKRKGLSVRCRRSGGSVTMHIASTSGKPLRKLVGPRLIIGMVQSRRDSGGGQLRFRFKKH